MKRAYCLIREAPVYRAEAFRAGLEACGFHVSTVVPTVVNPGDVLVIWNRYWERHDLATRFKAARGIVIVAENGYLLPGGGSPHGQSERTWFALALDYHNDETVVPDADASRWDALGIELKPWRTVGSHILVCPNRNFGTPGRIMPSNWAQDVARRLASITRRHVRVRPHPQNNAPPKPLAEDLAGAWATVIWSSSAGVHSLIAGVPVICEAPNWICKSTAYRAIEALEFCPLSADGRRVSMERLAWANWSLAEITSGESFDHLLRPAGKAEVCAAD